MAQPVMAARVESTMSARTDRQVDVGEPKRFGESCDDFKDRFAEGPPPHRGDI
jgi:hypothetical protein